MRSEPFAAESVEWMAKVAAGELVAAGGCSPHCLLAMGEESRKCRCRCEGGYHGVLRDAEVQLVADLQQDHDPSQPQVLVPKVRDDGWSVRCPFCRGWHLHGAAIGRRGAHCLRGDYLIAPPFSVFAPYADSSDHGCGMMRDGWTPIELTAGRLPGNVHAYYRCAAGHVWGRSWGDMDMGQAAGGRWSGTAWR